METIKKIDIHAHATRHPQLIPANPANNQPLLGAEKLLKMYDELNIEKGVLLPMIAPEAQWVIMTSEDCKLIADDNPERFIWFCAIDPRMGNNTDSADLTYLAEHYKKLGAKGMGELSAQLFTDDSKMDNLFACLESLEMPLTIHIAPHFDGCYGIVDDLGLPRLEKMLKKHPKLKVLGHSQCFWSEISSDNNDEIRRKYPTGKVTEGRIAELMRRYENLYCDLSAGSGKNAMTRDPEYAVSFLEEFSDRILYGCDICAATNKHPYAFDEFLTSIRESGAIREETYRKIVRENAIKLLGL